MSMDPAALLAALRWREDMVVTNHDGDRVWLRASFIAGERDGVTDCCPESSPCAWHGAITGATTAQGGGDAN